METLPMISPVLFDAELGVDLRFNETPEIPNIGKRYERKQHRRRGRNPRAVNRQNRRDSQENPLKPPEEPFPACRPSDGKGKRGSISEDKEHSVESVVR